MIDVTGLDTAVSTGTDFRGAHFGGRGLVQATLEQATLDGATFQPGSDLTGIRFNRSSLKNVNLGGLRLYGASFTQANLESSSLVGALLSNNPDGGIPTTPADFTGARLKDVNRRERAAPGHRVSDRELLRILRADRPGRRAFPASPTAAECGSTRVTGYTCSCATAVGATMSRTDFSGAFLFGVDFSDGVDGRRWGGVQRSAILVGANFDAGEIPNRP